MAQAPLETCEICVSAPYSSYCLDCKQYYCENCKVLHSRQTLFANHKFKETSDFIPEVKSKCTDHNEELFCVPCDVLVCVRCVSEKHNGHKLSHLKDIIVQLKTKIEQEILTKINKSSGNVFWLKQNLSAFNGEVEAVIKSITEEGNEIKSMVDQYTAKQIASFQEQARKESERLKSILSYNETNIDKAYVLENRKKSLGGQRNDGTLIETLISLNQDIERLEVRSLPKFSSITYIPKLVDENDIRQLLGSYELCEFQTGTTENPEKRHRGIFYQCSNCGNQKKDNPNKAYSSNHFTCCQMTMERQINK
ncbi:unnamed protein product [Mytilus coruscus]|uniref:B box-type domain-containing protein n=1 Tax=Mytilus coruscus TaxID=42192 RepID=A0A6J8DGR1_MYTCO|nr:unnamed protein product [Mytilus coruscus]